MTSYVSPHMSRCLCTTSPSLKEYCIHSLIEPGSWQLACISICTLPRHLLFHIIFCLQLLAHSIPERKVSSSTILYAISLLWLSIICISLLRSINHQVYTSISSSERIMNQTKIHQVPASKSEGRPSANKRRKLSDDNTEDVSHKRNCPFSKLCPYGSSCNFARLYCHEAKGVSSNPLYSS